MNQHNRDVDITRVTVWQLVCLIDILNESHLLVLVITASTNTQQCQPNQFLSMFLSPLYRLLKKGIHWYWSDDQKKAFKQAKQMLQR